MARSTGALGIITLCFLIGLVACQKKPLSKPKQPLLPPLLPPVPSRQQTELLTRQQLSFIRHHQKKQQLDQVNYNPYLCLPKYLCIVDDEEGNKRTTIVNGLHPVLRENSNKNSQDLGFGPTGPINVPKLSIRNVPGSGINYKERAGDDEFLWDQEVHEQAALERQQRQAFLNFQKQEKESRENDDSTEGDSIESNEESDDNKSTDNDSQEDERSKSSNRQKNDKPSSAESFEGLQKEVDDGADSIVTVPWDDRPKNKTQTSLAGRLQFSFPSLPKIPFLSSKHNDQSPPTKQRSILRRMLGVRKSFFRAKRDVSKVGGSDIPFMTKLGPGIKSSEQCRVLYNGCDLNYEQVMQIAANGQVLIEGDSPKKTSEEAVAQFAQFNLGIKAEDDEADQAVRDSPKKFRPRPFEGPKRKPGFGFKVKGSKYGNSESAFNKIKPKPLRVPGQENDEVDAMSVPSLPILPMRFTWGRPNFYKGRPPYPNLFDDLDSRRPTPPPTTTPPPTSPPPPSPVFVNNPVYKKVNRTVTTTNVVQINATHALEIVVPSSKPFRPMKTSVHDKNGRPSSFASVFTEIAGTSGGLHDFFDKIANTVGHQPTKRRTQKQISAPVKRASKIPAYRIKPKQTQKIKKKEQEDESKSEEDEEEDDTATKNQDEEEDEEEDDEEADDKIVTKNDDQEDEVADDEGNKNEESNEEDDEDKTKDDVDLPEGMPEHIKEAILEDIKTGGKKNKDGPDPPQGQGQGQAQGQGHSQGQGYPQQRPGHGPPQHQQQAYRPGQPPGRPGPNRPPPRRGMFPFF